MASRFIPDFNDGMEPIGKVTAFRFKNQNNQTFTNKDVYGKIYVADFFFTTCPGICPMMHDNLKKVYNQFGEDNNFLIVSHTSDPETDSVSRLKAYADSLGVNADKWIFLTGRKDSLYRMARFSYQIDDQHNNVTNIEDDFVHSQKWSLVNDKGQVIGVYDGLDAKDIKRMTKRIEKLLAKKNL